MIDMNIFINMMTHLLTEHCPAILVSMPVFVIMITPTSMNTLPVRLLGKTKADKQDKQYPCTQVNQT